MDKFDKFMFEEWSNCEKFLKEKGYYDEIPPGINVGYKEWVEKHGPDNAWEHFSEMEKIVKCYDTLSLIFKYLGQEKEAKKFFSFLSTIGLPESKYHGLSDESKKDWDMLTQQGSWQLSKGIHLNLAVTNPSLARQFYKWCEENCRLSSETLSGMVRDKNFDFIAVAFLWRGYSLILLGRYEEAYELLKEVVPYLNRYKKLGIEMWRKVEYALPKALLPLCEYELNPTEDNRQKAKAGLEEYIKSLKEFKDRLEGYLYYYHLKEAFPDVYGDRVAAGKAMQVLEKKGVSARPVMNGDVSSGFYETHGAVIVFDMESGSLELFGTNQELEKYVEKVKSLGEYPTLSRLMEIYALEDEQDPKPLIIECNKLLSARGLDDWTRIKTERVLAVARDAEKAGSGVMLYFDPEIGEQDLQA